MCVRAHVYVCTDRRRWRLWRDEYDTTTTTTTTAFFLSRTLRALSEPTEAQNRIIENHGAHTRSPARVLQTDVRRKENAHIKHTIRTRALSLFLTHPFARALTHAHADADEGYFLRGSGLSREGEQERRRQQEGRGKESEKRESPLFRLVLCLLSSRVREGRSVFLVSTVTRTTRWNSGSTGRWYDSDDHTVIPSVFRDLELPLRSRSVRTCAIRNSDLSYTCSALEHPPRSFSRSRARDRSRGRLFSPTARCQTVRSDSWTARCTGGDDGETSCLALRSRGWRHRGIIVHATTMANQSLAFSRKW